MGLRGLDGLSSQPFIPCLPLKAGKYTSLGQGPVDRLLSSSRAEPSGRQYGKTAQVSAQLFRPPIFDPRKLTTTFLPGASGTEPQPPAPRRYTLTHNDITGQLNLSIGCTYNTVQVSGWYTRLIRDEVLAEWCLGSDNCIQLHVYCHVSGEERWLAPPALRNYIFQREMPLVLDTILHADRALFKQLGGLADAAVVVHLSSHLTDLNMSVEWGTLSERASWPASERSMLQMLWSSLASRAQPASAAEVRQLVSLTGSITEQLQQTSSTQQLKQTSMTKQLLQSSRSVLSPSGVSREELDPSSEPLLIDMDAGSCVADSLPQRQDSASAASGSVQQGSANFSAAEDCLTDDPGFSLSAADAKAERLRMYKSAAADASWSSGNYPDLEGDGCGSSTVQGGRASSGQQSYRRSGQRGNKGPKTGIILPEGNILEFDHGGSERRPGGMQIATASSSVSEWLASGHEVISVRL